LKASRVGGPGQVQRLLRPGIGRSFLLMIVACRAVSCHVPSRFIQIFVIGGNFLRPLTGNNRLPLLLEVGLIHISTNFSLVKLLKPSVGR
jgi:hypothetical protein